MLENRIYNTTECYLPKQGNYLNGYLYMPQPILKELIHNPQALWWTEGSSIVLGFSSPALFSYW